MPIQNANDLINHLIETVKNAYRQNPKTTIVGLVAAGFYLHLEWRHTHTIDYDDWMFAGMIFSAFAVAKDGTSTGPMKPTAPKDDI